ncbi:hypothetical protein chiPu_0022357 [Chiloscyllium punctatum]|uniref:Uncharacterized protein n=1 Tax=Chiloscyllium punctatum TaxID=137246 RepID=A0A401RJD7_CHIPU|nr:hypothetical protein [Chiloscyllium punctatum]
MLGSRASDWLQLTSPPTGEERGMIRRAAGQEWEKRHPVGEGGAPAEQKFPNVDPDWENNEREDVGIYEKREY